MIEITKKHIKRVPTSKYAFYKIFGLRPPIPWDYFAPHHMYVGFLMWTSALVLHFYPITWLFGLMLFLDCGIMAFMAEQYKHLPKYYFAIGFIGLIISLILSYAGISLNMFYDILIVLGLFIFFDDIVEHFVTLDTPCRHFWIWANKHIRF